MKIEEKDIIRAVKEAKGSVGNAAVILRVARKTVYNRICKSSELKAGVDAIIKACRDERKNSKKFFFGKEKRVSITVPKSKTGTILSDRMQKILDQTRGKYASIYNLAIDQLDLRELMAETKKKYQGGDVEFKEYAFIMNMLHRTYTGVAKSADELALKKLDGKTPSQIYDSLFNFARDIIETFKEIIDDESIERGSIIREFEERIKLREG